MRNLLTGILTGAVLMLGACRADAQTWSGCYAGLNAGMAATKHDTTLDVAGAGTLLDLGLGSAGGTIGVHGGCDLKFDKLVFGAFADYVWHNQSINISVPLAGLQIAKASLETQWTVGARAGLMVSDATLAYVLVGWTRMDTSDLALLGGAAVVSLPTFEGVSFGGGLETEIAPNIRLGAEYRYTRFDRQSAEIIPGVLAAGLQPEMHAVTARLSYQIPVSGVSAK